MPWQVVENSPYASSDPVREFQQTVGRLHAQNETGQTGGAQLVRDLSDLRRQQQLYEREVAHRTAFPRPPRAVSSFMGFAVKCHRLGPPWPAP